MESLQQSRLNSKDDETYMQYNWKKQLQLSQINTRIAKTTGIVSWLNVLTIINNYVHMHSAYRPYIQYPA